MMLLIASSISRPHEMGTSVRKALEEVFRGNLFDASKAFKKEYSPSVVIETGTGNGLGSTALVANVVRDIQRSKNLSDRNVKIYTIEKDMKLYKAARLNMLDFPFVKVIHGSSLDLEDCKDFIRTDPLIRERESFPEVAIEGDVDFYLKELGDTVGRGEDNALARLLVENASKRILFVLDSAEGIGWYEFQTIVKVMLNRRYYMMFSCFDSLKHWRSMLYIENHLDEWKILAKKKWAVCLHRGSAGNTCWSRRLS